MSRNLNLFVVTALVAGLSTAALGADQASPAEAKLREALRAMTLQLRDVQNQLATAQETQTESDQKVKDLTEQTQKMTKQAIEDKAASDKSIADWNAKNAAQSKQIDEYKAALAKWEAGYKLAATTARAKEAERARLAGENILLQRRVDDLETKNTTLFQLGSDILTRYEKFGLGQAIAAKEPFVGTMRVKLENQVQDYQNKLMDQKSTPPPANAQGNPQTATAPAPSATPARKQ